MILGNYTVLHKSASTFIGGATVSPERSNWSGENRNRYIGNFDKKSGLPSGHLAPSSWSLPQQAGGLSSSAPIALSGAALGAAGINIVGATSFAITADALGQLIASAIGAADITITTSGSIVATLGAPGSASISITATGEKRATANAAGIATIELSAALVSYGTGSMSGLAYLAGEAVANDLDAVVEGDLTARQVLRVLLAGIAGRTAGVGTSTETYLGTDGATARIVTTFDASSNRLTVTLDGE